jgi:hypothetical protein
MAVGVLAGTTGVRPRAPPDRPTLPLGPDMSDGPSPVPVQRSGLLLSMVLSVPRALGWMNDLPKDPSIYRGSIIAGDGPREGVLVYVPQ